MFETKEIHQYFQPLNTRDCHLWVLQPLHRADEDGVSVENLSGAERHAFEKKYYRAVMQALLAAYTGLEEEDIRIHRDEFGKPFVDHQNIHFNLSHSGDYGVFGVSHAHLGVDLELVRDRRSSMRVAERFFHPEEIAYLKSLEEDEQRLTFHKIWVVKEALLKADGRGLRGGLADFSAVNADGTYVDEIHWKKHAYSIRFAELASYYTEDINPVCAIAERLDEKKAPVSEETGALKIFEY